MRSRNTLLGLFIAVLGGALLALVYFVAPADLAPGTVEASTTVSEGATSESATVDAGGNTRTGGEAEGAGRVEVPGEEVPLETGAFEATALYGRVVDPAGEGLEGALVYVFPEINGRDDPGPPRAEGTTDAGGRFRFRNLEEHTPYLLFATADGFRPARETWSCGRDGDVRLEPAHSIAGRVLDAESSTPLAGVEVAVEMPWVEEETLRGEITATSDEEGRYRLAPMRTEGLQRLLARRPGHLEERVELQILPGRTEGYDLRLTGGPSVVLEFYDLTTGDLLPGTVVALDRGGEHTTDEEGRIEVTLRPSRSRNGSSLQVEATIDGWCRTSASLPLVDGVPPEFARVPLCRGGVVRGKVTADGKPVEDVRVDYFTVRRSRRMAARAGPSRTFEVPQGFSMRDGERRAMTAADGSYAIRGVVPLSNPAGLQANHVEYRPQREENLTPPDVGEELEVDLALATGSVVHGTVRMNGDPIAADLYWWGEGGGGRAFSNDRGKYRFEGVGEGEVKITLQSRNGSWGGGREEQDTVWVEANSIVEHDIERFSAKSVISGVVRDAGGSLLADLEVTTWAERERMMGGGAGGRATTAADGTFTLEVDPLPGAPYSVHVRDGARRATEKNVAAGTTGLELVLPEMGRIGLRVVDESTRDPLPRYQVHWRTGPEDGYELLRLSGREVSPGPDGIFVAELPLGPVDLLVGSPDQGYATLELERRTVDRRDPPGIVDVVLPRATKVELRFLPAEGSPGGRPPRALQRGRIALAAPGEVPAGDAGAARRALDTLALRGRAIRAYRTAVTLEAIEPGRYRFEGLPDDLVLEPREIDVPAREKATFEIRWRTADQR